MSDIKVEGRRGQLDQGRRKRSEKKREIGRGN